MYVVHKAISCFVFCCSPGAKGTVGTADLLLLTSPSSLRGGASPQPSLSRSRKQVRDRPNRCMLGSHCTLSTGVLKSMFLGWESGNHPLKRFSTCRRPHPHLERARVMSVSPSACFEIIMPFPRCCEIRTLPTKCSCVF